MCFGGKTPPILDAVTDFFSDLASSLGLCHLLCDAKLAGQPNAVINIRQLYNYNAGVNKK